MPGQLRGALYGVALVAMLTPCRAASGQIVHVFGEVQTRLERGDHVSVTDVTGRATRGRVVDVSALSLQLLDGGELRTFEGATLHQIDRFLPDSVRNGVLWGLAIGAGAGLLSIPIAGASGASLDSASTVSALALIVGPVAGAAVGGAVDASRTASETLYVRIGSATHPRGLSWTLNAGGVAVSLGIGF